MSTTFEFGFVIILMFIGVIFYSNIFAELLEIIENTLEKAEQVQEKAHYLKELKKHFGISSGIFRFMLKIIENSVASADAHLVENELDIETLDFKNVNQRDVDLLMVESYSSRMTGLMMFHKIDKKVLVEFGKHAKLYRYEANQEIYKAGDYPEKFFVIKSGVAVFRAAIKEMNNQLIDFYEISDGYFGEMEMMSESEVKMPRKFAVWSRTAVECFAIDRKTFRKLFVFESSPISAKFSEAAKHRSRRILNALAMINLLSDEFKVREREFNGEGVPIQRAEFLARKFCNKMLKRHLGRELKMPYELERELNKKAGKNKVEQAKDGRVRKDRKLKKQKE